MAQVEAATHSDGIARFSYHRSVGPMVGVLFGLAVTETLVVHLVVFAAWGWKVAAVLGVIDLSAIVTLIRLLRSFKRLPVTIEGRHILLHAGYLRRVVIDADNIAGLRADFDRAAIKRKGVANLALIA